MQLTVCRRLFVWTLLQLHLLDKVLLFFRHESIVIFAEIASFLPQLVQLRIVAFGNGPDALSLSLVSLTVLFDPLLNLPLVQPVRRRPPAVLRGGLRLRSVHHLDVDGRRREA